MRSNRAKASFYNVPLSRLGDLRLRAMKVAKSMMRSIATAVRSMKKSLFRVVAERGQNARGNLVPSPMAGRTAKRRSEITVKKQMRLALVFPKCALRLFHSQSQVSGGWQKHIEFPESFESRRASGFTPFSAMSDFPGISNTFRNYAIEKTRCLRGRISNTRVGLGTNGLCAHDERPVTHSAGMAKRPAADYAFWKPTCRPGCRSIRTHLTPKVQSGESMTCAVLFSPSEFLASRLPLRCNRPASAMLKRIRQRTARWRSAAIDFQLALSAPLQISTFRRSIRRKVPASPAACDRFLSPTLATGRTGLP